MKKKTVLAPTSQAIRQVLGKSERIAHAAKCGTCSCKCACRYDVNIGKKKPIW